MTTTSSPSAASSRPSRPPSSCRRSGPPWTTSSIPTTTTDDGFRGNADGGARPPRQRDGTAWDQPLPPPRRKEDTESLADALVGICADYLAGRAAQADNPDTYQVIIHAGTAALAGPQQPADVPAETRKALAALAETVPLLAFPESHPAWPMRCHLEDGAAISPATLQTIACNATISAMLHDADGSVLNVGRRTRKLSAALRRAVRERDRHRLPLPRLRVPPRSTPTTSGTGPTAARPSSPNLISLCKAHHHLVHDKGIIIAATGGGFAFYLPSGARLSNSPPLPPSSPTPSPNATGPRSPRPPSSRRTPAAAST